jgi:hypothetical protein
MKRFILLIGPRDCPRIRLDVMATDSVAAIVQHMDLAEPGDRIEVEEING